MRRLSQAGFHRPAASAPTKLPTKWVVDCKCVGSGQKALVYLGRYLHRGVIQERDIVRCDNDHVTYRWRDNSTGKMALCTVRGEAFLWLVLQHVLPKGFRRARKGWTTTRSATESGVVRQLNKRARHLGFELTPNTQPA